MKDESVKWINIFDNDLSNIKDEHKAQRNRCYVLALSIITSLTTLLTVIEKTRFNVNTWCHIMIFISALAWSLLALGAITAAYHRPKYAVMLEYFEDEDKYDYPIPPGTIVTGIIFSLMAAFSFISIAYVAHLNLHGTFSIPYLFGFVIGFVSLSFLTTRIFFRSSLRELNLNRVSIEIYADAKKESIMSKGFGAGKKIGFVVFVLYAIFLFSYSWLLFKQHDEVYMAVLFFIILISISLLFKSLQKWIMTGYMEAGIIDIRNWVMLYEPPEDNIQSYYILIMRPFMFNRTRIVKMGEGIKEKKKETQEKVIQNVTAVKEKEIEKV